MKNIIISIALVIFLLVLSGCTLQTQVTLYMVSQKEQPGSLKKIGCEEYLIPVKEEVFGNVSDDALVTKSLELLFQADSAKYGEGLLTATAITDQYLALESVEKRTMGSMDGFLVSLKRNEGKGLAGVCDVPRLKEQILETVRAAAGSNPFSIRIDGDVKKWECLSDESGMCGA